MEVTITYTDKTTRILKPSVYFDPHNYMTDGDRKTSNIHALIEDLSKGKTIYRVIAEDFHKGRIIDKMPNPIPVKTPFAKTKEEREEGKRIKALAIQDTINKGGSAEWQKLLVIW